jgi:transcriptional regulator with XRE-family HTH domain
MEDNIRINWAELGKLILLRRKDKGLNQSQLAELVKLSQPVISLAERGSSVGITDDKLDLILDNLDISIEEVPRFDIAEKKSAASSKRKKIFISYSHKDRSYFDRLSVHLKPLEKKGLIEPWSDTRISAGAHWKKEIEKALNSAQVAVLLISADFLASDFIVDNELPPLLTKANEDGATIIPIILKPCRFVRESSLSKFQAINIPEEPIISASEHESELIYDAVAQRIEELIN